MKTFLLIGNPNTGKSTLFNALTGLNQKVGNYPGVTVEKREGQFISHGVTVKLVDLPGTYSLIPNSPDEEIVKKTLVDRQGEPFDGVIIIADATNLPRNLYLATQIIDCGHPTILVLNMIDEAHKKNIHINTAALSKALGIPVVTTAAHKKNGISELKNILTRKNLPAAASLLPQLRLPESIKAHLHTFPNLQPAEVLRLLTRDDMLEDYPENIRIQCLTQQKNIQFALEEEHVDWRNIETEARYAFIDHVIEQSVRLQFLPQRKTFADRLDAVVTHKMFGPVIFVGLMGFIFQALFSWASYPMDSIDTLFGMLSQKVQALFPSGPIQSLLANGIIPGIGAVVIFIPQIAFLFFFISLLEDTGYMARAAFVMDRLMAKFGLHGKSFIPLMSSFACAIPGIMATRTIESKRDRLLTILIAPLMSCSARLPVYTLLIAACIPSLTFFGFINLQGIILWGLYLLGIVAAFGMAFLFKRTILTAPSMPFLIEFPPYRVPQFSVVLKKTWERAYLFLTNAGTIILALSILLWFLTSYPQGDIGNSFAGKLGKFIEPVIQPLGFDWKIGIGLIASFAAREVMVSTMAIVYHLQDAGETSLSLINAIRTDIHPDGTPIFTPLVALSLLVFYVLACQCMSTVAVVKRETNSWRWPVFLVGYMTGLAYVASFVVYQVGRLLGY